jgi:hypothetical protein
MTEQAPVSQQISSRELSKLTTALLYLSRSEAGWEGLVAQAFNKTARFWKIGASFQRMLAAQG